MTQVTNVTMTGFVTAEPKLRHTRENTPYATIRVGSTTRVVDRETGEWRDGDTSYYKVTCWRRLAVNAAASLHKGNPVLIRGRFRTRTWEDQGRVRTEVQIEADCVGHDLRLGWANFQRNPYVPPNIADDLAAGEIARQGLTPGGPGGPGAGIPGIPGIPGDASEPDDALGPAEPEDGQRFGGPGAVLAADGDGGPLAPQDAAEYAEPDDMFNGGALADLARQEAGDQGQEPVAAPEPVPAPVSAPL